MTYSVMLQSSDGVVHLQNVNPTTILYIQTENDT